MDASPTYDRLPEACTRHGRPRRVGIELEFGGLPEGRAAKVVADVAGGSASQCKDGTWRVRTGPFGRCELYLDTRFREDVKEFGWQPAVDLARLVVPVELVTEPFDPAHRPRFDVLVRALRDSGAVGSRSGLLLGFGVHLNVEVADTGPDHLWRRVTAYALMEEELRRSPGVELSRRVLPFVKPYPDALVDDLAAGSPPTIDALIECYLAHAPTRNHGLDMLPIFAHLAPGAVEGRLAGSAGTKPRPAYHFRMPDCRIDEPGWSIQEPWHMWLAVERLAASPERFERLREARLRWSEAPALRRARWSGRVAEILGAGSAEARP